MRDPEPHIANIIEANIGANSNSILQPRIKHATRFTRLSDKRQSAFLAMKNVFENSDVVAIILSNTKIDTAACILQTCNAFSTLPPMFRHLENLVFSFDETIKALKVSYSLLEDSIKIEDRYLFTQEELDEAHDVLAYTSRTTASCMELKKKALMAQLSVIRAWRKKLVLLDRYEV